MYTQDRKWSHHLSLTPWFWLSPSLRVHSVDEAAEHSTMNMRECRQINRLCLPNSLSSNRASVACSHRGSTDPVNRPSWPLRACCQFCMHMVGQMVHAYQQTSSLQRTVERLCSSATRLAVTSLPDKINKLARRSKKIWNYLNGCTKGSCDRKQIVKYYPGRETIF